MPKYPTIYAADWENKFVFNYAMLCGVENVLHKVTLTDCYILSAGIIVHHANIVIFVLYENEGVQHWGCYIFRRSQLHSLLSWLCNTSHLDRLYQIAKNHIYPAEFDIR